MKQIASGEMIRVMLCTVCRQLEPHLVKRLGLVGNSVRIGTLCVRKFRKGDCHHYSERVITIGSYNALVDNEYL